MFHSSKQNRGKNRKCIIVLREYKVLQNWKKSAIIDKYSTSFHNSSLTLYATCNFVKFIFMKFFVKLISRKKLYSLKHLLHYVFFHFKKSRLCNIIWLEMIWRNCIKIVYIVANVLYIYRPIKKWKKIIAHRICSVHFMPRYMYVFRNKMFML